MKLFKCVARTTFPRGLYCNLPIREQHEVKQNTMANAILLATLFKIKLQKKHDCAHAMATNFFCFAAFKTRKRRTRMTRVDDISLLAFFFSYLHGNSTIRSLTGPKFDTVQSYAYCYQNFIRANSHSVTCTEPIRSLLLRTTPHSSLILGDQSLTSHEATTFSTLHLHCSCCKNQDK